MKQNPLVLQRFRELAAKAQMVSRRNPGDGTLQSVDLPQGEAWGTSALSLIQRVFGEDSVHFTNLKGAYERFDGYEFKFQCMVQMVAAAQEDYEGGYLFNMHSLVKAEVCTDVLEQAQVLLDAGYKDPACVVAGVVLENTLGELCDREGIPRGKLDTMNSELVKAGVYNKGMQKQITAWADRRNCAAHGKWNEYNEADVKDLIAGATRLIAEFL